MNWSIALHAVFAGMVKGMFTGKKLSDYISDGRADYVGARRIINGMDRAKLIARFAQAFRDALRQSRRLDGASTKIS